MRLASLLGLLLGAGSAAYEQLGCLLRLQGMDSAAP